MLVPFLPPFRSICSVAGGPKKRVVSASNVTCCVSGVDTLASTINVSKPAEPQEQGEQSHTFSERPTSENTAADPWKLLQGRFALSLLLASQPQFLNRVKPKPIA